MSGDGRCLCSGSRVHRTSSTGSVVNKGSRGTDGTLPITRGRSARVGFVDRSLRGSHELCPEHAGAPLRWQPSHADVFVDDRDSDRGRAVFDETGARRTSWCIWPTGRIACRRRPLSGGHLARGVASSFMATRRTSANDRTAHPDLFVRDRIAGSTVRVNRPRRRSRARSPSFLRRRLGVAFCSRDLASIPLDHGGRRLLVEDSPVGDARSSTEPNGGISCGPLFVGDSLPVARRAVLTTSRWFGRVPRVRMAIWTRAPPRRPSFSRDSRATRGDARGLGHRTDGRLCRSGTAAPDPVDQQQQTATFFVRDTSRVRPPLCRGKSRRNRSASWVGKGINSGNLVTAWPIRW
jgi:hypothetical protein